MEDKLFKIKLYGSLAKSYGRAEIQLYAKDLRDIFAGLTNRFGDGFQETILNGAWHIVTGEKKGRTVKAEDNFLEEKLVEFPLQDNRIHIFPAVTGAGKVGSIILGVVLIAFVVFFPYIGAPIIAGATTGFGAIGMTSLALGITGVMAIASGVSELMTKSPKVTDYASAGPADQRPSFIFNGIVNNTEQGVPIPLLYGLHLTGSTVISAGMDVERVAA